LGMLTATGTVLPRAGGMPSSPSAPRPHAHALPFGASANTHERPAETELNVTPFGILTGTGMELPAVVPFPSWTWPWSPHAHASPLLSRVRPVSKLAEIDVKAMPGGILTVTGTLVPLTAEPLPSCPYPLSPHVHAFPFESSARLK